MRAFANDTIPTKAMRNRVQKVEGGEIVRLRAMEKWSKRARARVRKRVTPNYSIVGGRNQRSTKSHNKINAMNRTEDKKRQLCQTTDSIWTFFSLQLAVFLHAELDGDDNGALYAHYYYSARCSVCLFCCELCVIVVMRSFAAGAIFNPKTNTRFTHSAASLPYFMDASTRTNIIRFVAGWRCHSLV